MSTALLDISAALDSHLNTMAGLPPVAWENLKYESILGTLYLRPTNIRGDTYAETEKDINIGIYMIDIFSEAGQGRNESIVMADLLSDRFKIDTEVTYNGVTVRIESVSCGSGLVLDDGWYQLPVSINYYSFTARR